MFGRDSADRLTNIRNKGGDNLLCEEYIAAKILVRCFGIYALNTDSFGKRSAFDTSLSGQALLTEINSDTLQYNELCGNDDEDQKFDLEGFMETEDSLPEGIMKRYAFLKNQLCEEPLSIPVSLKKVYDKLSYQVQKVGLFPPPFKENLELLGKCFELTEKELCVYGTLNLVAASSLVREAFNCFIYKNKGEALIHEVVASVLDMQKEEVSQILNPKNRLTEIGLINKEGFNQFSEDAEDIFEISPSSSVSPRDLLWKPQTMDDFLGARVTRLGKTQNELNDFAYLPAVRDTILPFLRALQKDTKTGVNILLYGPSGSGKTELSKVLAEEADFEAYELSEENRESNDKWKNWKIACTVLRNKPRAMITVDEADDFFNGSFDPGSGRRTNKGQIIRALETSATPTIWTTNSIIGMDPAIIRRFKFVLEVGYPPKKQMKKIAETKLGAYLSQENLARIVNTSHLSPAILAQVGNLAESLNGPGNKVSEDRLMSVISDVLKAQGFGALAPLRTLSTLYDPKLTNTLADLAGIAKGLRKTGSGRICLYGPPGTGKTAFGHWISEFLGKPLIVKQASDLLNCFVGGTEQNIRRAFEDAKLNDSILLIDEADSFLRNRKESNFSWEVTQVNEFLSNMETFSGIFIATTNLLDIVDNASMRRFDVKIKFDFLRPEQTESLFRKYAKKWHFRVKDKELEALTSLPNLAPGDFAAVDRLMRLTEKPTSTMFIQALLQEADLKETKGEAKRSIGFV